MIPGQPAQLLANVGSFILLFKHGEVYTFGDARYQSLGRSVSGDGATPPGKPGIVEALAGLKITKIASGGWMSLAISEDGALYLWGTMLPNSHGIIDALASNEVSLVELPTDHGAEPLDIIDAALGDNHVAILTHDRRVFAVGDNSHGQLGLGSRGAFFGKWQEVSGLSEITSVFCGPKCTLLLAAPCPDHA
jgi:hypothetical protein